MTVFFVAIIVIVAVIATIALSIGIVEIIDVLVNRAIDKLTGTDFKKHTDRALKIIKE